MKRAVVTAAAALSAVVVVLLAPPMQLGDRGGGETERPTELGQQIDDAADRLCRWIERTESDTQRATDALENETDRLHARFGGNWRDLRSEIISRQGEVCRDVVERMRQRG